MLYNSVIKIFLSERLTTWIISKSQRIFRGILIMVYAYLNLLFANKNTIR